MGLIEETTNREKFLLEETKKAWLQLGLNSVTLSFSCGGDSMEDLSIEVFSLTNEPDISITYDEDVTKTVLYSNDLHLQNLFQTTLDNIITFTYKYVDFYVDSDGYYNGEDGNVEIYLNEEETEFIFEKDSTESFTEYITLCKDLNLTPEEEVLNPVIFEAIHSLLPHS